MNIILYVGEISRRAKIKSLGKSQINYQELVAVMAIVNPYLAYKRKKKESERNSAKDVERRHDFVIDV